MGYILLFLVFLSLPPSPNRQHHLKKFMQYCSGGSRASAAISALPGWAATSCVRQTESSLLLGFWSLPSLYLFRSVWDAPFSIGMGQCLLLSSLIDHTLHLSSHSSLLISETWLCAVLAPPVERSSLCLITLALNTGTPRKCADFYERLSSVSLPHQSISANSKT